MLIINTATTKHPLATRFGGDPGARSPAHGAVAAVRASRHWLSDVRAAGPRRPTHTASTSAGSAHPRSPTHTSRLPACASAPRPLRRGALLFLHLAAHRAAFLRGCHRRRRTQQHHPAGPTNCCASPDPHCGAYGSHFVLKLPWRVPTEIGARSAEPGSPNTRRWSCEQTLAPTPL